MARPPSEHPTSAELSILKVLWAHGPSTVRQVHEALRETGAGYTTVLKQLQIMMDKGLVNRDERQRAHVYAAATQQQQVERGLVTDLLDRVFNGSSSQLVQQALSSRRASPEELRKIREILAQHEGPEGQ